MAADAPIVIAYDGSPAAQAAVKRAGELFRGRSALVLTAWDPRLGEMMMMPDPTGLGTTTMPYDPTLAREIDREVEHTANEIATAGAKLARSGGLKAKELVVEDVSHTADAILAAAGEHDAAAIVIGSRGHRGLRSRLLGSTSGSVLRGAGERPVMIVHAPVGNNVVSSYP
jgi:nucleotide-binding universal stress UspA family protein